ncbi:MAG: phosphomannose isomerase type II C-terminal cupin domain [Candidatus Taylorbacteria bacterium]|nr:phosphomannose isomerase type II C-terminal cupin domain [Candidatus Taylorbacteria bacterium]
MNIPKPYSDARPWGNELWFTRESGAPSMVKIITVNPKESLSLQYHIKREEFWFVMSGSGIAQIGTERIPLETGNTCFVPKQAHHRITAGDASPLVFLELAFGEFDENDIVRLEDKYGRVTANAKQ